MSGRLLPFFSLIIAGIVFFVYIDPTYTGAIQTTQAAIASDNTALSEAAAYTAKENELASERDAISQSDLDKLNAFLPSSVSNVQIILDLDNLANRSGVVLSDINVDNPTSQAGSTAPDGSVGSDTSPVGTLDMKVTVTGTYQTFLTFLAGIESSQRLLDVQSIDVKNSDTGVYTFDLDVRLYWIQS